ncbi:hypothetical protein C8R43DRAFT_947247 [Mycena crocata]|nr:hypothetical protein C8R43DRAFT_947247 [Mycena crocata]
MTGQCCARRMQRRGRRSLKRKTRAKSKLHPKMCGFLGIAGAESLQKRSAKRRRYCNGKLTRRSQIQHGGNSGNEALERTRESPVAVGAQKNHATSVDVPYLVVQEPRCHQRQGTHEKPSAPRSLLASPHDGKNEERHRWIRQPHNLMRPKNHRQKVETGNNGAGNHLSGCAHGSLFGVVWGCLGLTKLTSRLPHHGIQLGNNNVFVPEKPRRTWLVAVVKVVFQDNNAYVQARVPRFCFVEGGKYEEHFDEDIQRSHSLECFWRRLGNIGPLLTRYFARCRLFDECIHPRPLVQPGKNTLLPVITVILEVKHHETRVFGEDFGYGYGRGGPREDDERTQSFACSKEVGAYHEESRRAKGEVSELHELRDRTPWCGILIGSIESRVLQASKQLQMRVRKGTSKNIDLTMHTAKRNGAARWKRIVENRPTQGSAVQNYVEVLDRGTDGEDIWNVCVRRCLSRREVEHEIFNRVAYKGFRFHRRRGNASNSIVSVPFTDDERAIQKWLNPKRDSELVGFF